MLVHVLPCVRCRGSPLRVYTNATEPPNSSGKAPQRSPANASGGGHVMAPATGHLVTYGGAWPMGSQPSAAAASLVAGVRPLRPVGLPSDYNNSYKSRTKAKLVARLSNPDAPAAAAAGSTTGSPAPAAATPSADATGVQAL
jgi:hypothetical protein